ncbi:MAG: hypothetical protein IPK16_00535 [Anaerolineales bacterium]|nr:hypothetical protein [Anaerolineales bacterium]
MSGHRLVMDWVSSVVSVRKSSMHRTHLISLLLGLALLLAACGGQRALPQIDESKLPQFLASAPSRVREAYRYAAANPDEMQKYPCYCGCNHMGHTSNLSCYVKDIDVKGAITFDEHATSCGICVDITQDVMHMTQEGKAPAEIRTYVDAQYSAFGPSTDTPLP